MFAFVFGPLFRVCVCVCGVGCGGVCVGVCVCVCFGGRLAFSLFFLEKKSVPRIN